MPLCLISQVHWFSILNSCMVVIVMSCIVAMIMMRTIRKDLAQYESLIVDPGAPWTPSNGVSVASWPHAGFPNPKIVLQPLPHLILLLSSCCTLIPRHPAIPEIIAWRTVLKLRGMRGCLSHQHGD